MSIAILSSIRPSSILMYMVVTMCVLSNILLAYCAIALVAGSTFWLLVLAGAGLLGVFASYRFFLKRVSFQLDISATGEIIFRRVGPDQEIHASERVHLSQGTTLWPMMMLLHFRSETGQTHVFPVLPDSVDPDAFRRLSVAFHWIMKHASTKQKSNLSQGNF